MHELNPADAQRVDDRRPLYVGLLRDEPMRELPDGSAIGRLCDLIDRVPMRHFWLGYAAFLLACAAGLHLIFN